MTRMVFRISLVVSMACTIAIGCASAQQPSPDVPEPTTVPTEPASGLTGTLEMGQLSYGFHCDMMPPVPEGFQCPAASVGGTLTLTNDTESVIVIGGSGLVPTWRVKRDAEVLAAGTSYVEIHVVQWGPERQVLALDDYGLASSAAIRIEPGTTVAIPFVKTVENTGTLAIEVEIAGQVFLSEAFELHYRRTF